MTTKYRETAARHKNNYVLDTGWDSSLEVRDSFDNTLCLVSRRKAESWNAFSRRASQVAKLLQTEAK